MPVHHRNEQESQSRNLALSTQSKDSLGYLHISKTPAYTHSFFYVLFVFDDSSFLIALFLFSSVYFVILALSLFIVLFVFYDKVSSLVHFCSISYLPFMIIVLLLIVSVSSPFRLSLMILASLMFYLS